MWMRMNASVVKLPYYMQQTYHKQTIHQRLSILSPDHDEKHDDDGDYARQQVDRIHHDASQRIDVRLKRACVCDRCRSMSCIVYWLTDVVARHKWLNMTTDEKLHSYFVVERQPIDVSKHTWDIQMWIELYQITIRSFVVFTWNNRLQMSTTRTMLKSAKSAN